MGEFKLLLASNSPRRRRLLAVAGYEFRLAPVSINEDVLPGEEPVAYVRRLAEAKARAAAHLAGPDEVILAADTTVADEDGILAKPVDATDAGVMLTRLRGHDHQVYTALALYWPAQDRLLLDACATRVTMRDYSLAEQQEYIASGDPLDKAGAYAIQHAGFHPVEALQGCYANVVGLPMCLLGAMLRQFGQRPPAGLPLCPEDDIDCPICAALARGEHAA